MNIYKEELFKHLDMLSEYHPDIAPKKRDSEETLLEKYFYWVTEYNDGYSESLMNPETDFDTYLVANAERFM